MIQIALWSTAKGSFTVLEDKAGNIMLKKNPLVNFLINLELLLFGSAMVFSGLLLQISYHMGHHEAIDTNHLALGLNYFNWSDIHLISIVLVSMGMVFHIIWHWKWYKAVVRKKNLVAKNQQAIILTIIFILVAITGYISWFIKLRGGSDLNRHLFLEIHDKITWVLLGYLIFHVTQRFKWYFTTYKKVKKYAKNEAPHTKGSPTGRDSRPGKCLLL
jgi:hypothetical protein